MKDEAAFPLSPPHITKARFIRTPEKILL